MCFFEKFKFGPMLPLCRHFGAHLQLKIPEGGYKVAKKWPKMIFRSPKRDFWDS